MNPSYITELTDNDNNKSHTQSLTFLKNRAKEPVLSFGGVARGSVVLVALVGVVVVFLLPALGDTTWA